jgi:predicted nuclease with TOPRIM domain
MDEVTPINKIPKEELDNLTKIADEYAQVTADIGRSTVQLHLLELEMTKSDQHIQNLHSRYDELIAEEAIIHEKLLTKYGQGQINFETGEFIPAE